MSRSNTGRQLTMKKTTSLELSDLMAKLEQIDKKLKCSEEDRQMLKKELHYDTTRTTSTNSNDDHLRSRTRMIFSYKN